MNHDFKDLFNRYLRHEEINAYLDHLAVKFPDNVVVKTCGRTYEGREMKSIRITADATMAMTIRTTRPATASTNSRQTSNVSMRAQSAAPTKTTMSKKSSKTTRRKSLGGSSASTTTTLLSTTTTDSAKTPSGGNAKKRKGSSSKSARSRSTKNSSISGSSAGNLSASPQSINTSSASALSSASKRRPHDRRRSDGVLKTIAENTNTAPLPKSVVLIDGGIHAREWISVATALYCVHQLTEYRKLHADLLQQLDFVIVPVVNADGYEYTHTHSRFWRKTRQPVQGCHHVGADCNRNFDYHWSSACSRASRYTFRGVKPFSEPETNILKSLMHSLSAHCKFYLTLHSYAQAFMYPWGYTRDLPSNWQELHRLAQAGHLAIKRKTGKHYRCGSVSLLIKHTAAGGSPDYALGAVKIPYAMTMELSGGGHGFDPPSTAIGGLVRESWIGIRAMCEHVADRATTGGHKTTAATTTTKTVT